MFAVEIVQRSQLTAAVAADLQQSKYLNILQINVVHFCKK